MAGQLRWDPEPRLGGLGWEEKRDRRKGTEMHAVMVAGGRQGTKGAPPYLKSFWDTSGQTMQEREAAWEVLGWGGRLELLLWRMCERTKEGDGEGWQVPCREPAVGWRPWHQSR